MLERKPPGTPSQDIQLSLSDSGLHPLNHFQQAAMEVVRIDLEHLDNQTRELVACVRDITGHATEKPASTDEPGAPEATEKWDLSPLDPDRVRAVVMVVASMWSATLVWIYIDPPGPVSWFQFVPSLALVAVQAPHVKIITMKLFALAYMAGLLVYVFVLPMLSVFWQLGTVLFTFSFVTAYFFSGMARVALFLAMFNMFGIQNTQTYNFAAMANTILFIMLALALVSAMTYITRTPRPEKAFLSLLGRFFHSSAFLVSRLAVPYQPKSLMDRMKTPIIARSCNRFPVNSASGESRSITAFSRQHAESGGGHGGPPATDRRSYRGADRGAPLSPSPACSARTTGRDPRWRASSIRGSSTGPSILPSNRTKT